MQQIIRTDVWAAADFPAVAGVNEGDPPGGSETLVPDDFYRLRPGTEPQRVTISRECTGQLRITGSARSGFRDTAMRADCVLTMMTEQNDILQITLLTQACDAGQTAARLIVATAPLTPDVSWRIVEISAPQCADFLLSHASPWFAAGTRVTLATGRLCPVENLRAGDRILTRDSGAQILRAVRECTTPVPHQHSAVRIGAGVLNNPRPVMLSAANRLVLPGREHAVTAGALVNGDSVTAWRCGHVEYFMLEFDAPETVYAEGISTATSADARAA